MKKLTVLVCILGLLVCAENSIAEDSPKCSLIPTEAISKGEGHYINPKQISSLILQDTNERMGTVGNLILIVSMNNGDEILYGRYQSEKYRTKSIKYLYNIVLLCNQ
jgi:hypothetical protein